MEQLIMGVTDLYNRTCSCVLLIVRGNIGTCFFFYSLKNQ